MYYLKCLTRIENIFKNKTKHYACAIEVPSIDLPRGEKLSSYFQKPLQYLGYHKKSYRYKQYHSEVKS